MNLFSLLSSTRLNPLSLRRYIKLRECHGSGVWGAE